MDDPDLEDYNVEERVHDFLNYITDDIQKFQEGPPNKHLIYTAGGDFHFQVSKWSFYKINACKSCETIQGL